jgi:hypothetical protein
LLSYFQQELPGTVYPAFFERLFRQQSAQWEPIALNHSNKVEEIVGSFNQTLMEDTVSEESLRAKIGECMLHFHYAAHVAAADQPDQIVRDEIWGILQTINHYFADTVSKTQEDWILVRLKGLGPEDGRVQQVYWKAITSVAHLSNEDQAVNDIHNVLKAYYQVAMKQFMNNVILQVVERIYLGDAGPMKAISPKYIGSLSETVWSNKWWGFDAKRFKGHSFIWIRGSNLLIWYRTNLKIECLGQIYGGGDWIFKSDLKIGKGRELA